MTKDEIEHVNALKQAVENLRDDHKPERERTACSLFLGNLGIPFNETQLKSVPKGEEPPDVTFADACFEVTEVLDQGRQRDREYKAIWKLVESSGDLAHAAHLAELKDIVPTEIGERARGAAENKPYDPATKVGLDLLVYVNLTEHSFRAGAMPNPLFFAPLGWRSLSVLFCWVSLVFYAAPTAPPFLQERAGKFTERIFPA